MMARNDPRLQTAQVERIIDYARDRANSSETKARFDVIAPMKRQSGRQEDIFARFVGGKRASLNHEQVARNRSTITRR